MENVASSHNISSFNKLPTIDMEEATIEVGANVWFQANTVCKMWLFSYLIV